MGAVDRTLGAIDIEGHALGRRSNSLVLHQGRVEANESLIVSRLGENSVSNQCSVDVSATLISRRSREANIRNVGSSASRSASLVSS